MDPNEIRVVYLDKNHNPETMILPFVMLIEKFIPSYIDYSIHFLIPKIIKNKIP